MDPVTFVTLYLFLLFPILHRTSLSTTLVAAYI